MKLGKKALSCLLAVMMIVTSVSVCFTSLAATGDTQAANLFNTIAMVYDDLKTGYDLDHAATPDHSHVPYTTGGNQWTVAVDGYQSGWFQTARSFYNYVRTMAATGLNRTCTQYVDDAIASMRSQGKFSGTLTEAEVTKYLDYFRFNGTTAAVDLHIGTGYDILAWAPNINAIETNRSYYTGDLHFGVRSGYVDDATSTWTEQTVVDPEASDQLTVADVKQALQDCVRADAFLTWFNLDFDNMEVEEIMALVQGENSCANTLAAFSLVANLSGSADDEELWDAYVAPVVGKTWDQTNEWVQSGLMGAIYKAYAADYTQQLNTIMAEDVSAYTGAQKRDYYNRFVQICLNLENQEDYQFNNIFEQILPYMADGFYNKNDTKGTIHANLWVSSASTVGAALATAKANVAKKFAEEYADAFMELIDREVPAYDRSNEKQAAAWLANPNASNTNAWDGVDDSQYMEGDYLDSNNNGVADRVEAEQFVAAATAMLANIDGDILPYGTFDTIKTSFGSANPNHNNDRNRITEDDYNALLAKIRLAQVNSNSASGFLNKAKMDAFIKSTILPGQTQANLQEIYTDYNALYVSVSSVRSQGGELYALVFGNGWKTDGTDEENQAFNDASLAAADEYFQQYIDYDHLIKATAIERLWTKLDIIYTKYYGSTGSARYYTFEAIIEAYSNLEITPANLFNWLNTGVPYVAQAGEHTQSELQTRYNSATTVYNSATAFKSGLRLLISARGSGAGADIEIQKYLFGVGGISHQTYGWLKSVNAIKVSDITAAVNSVGLTNYGTATDDNIKTLLSNAVNDLDQILVSNDVGSILDSLIMVDVKDNDGKYVYTYMSGGTEHEYHAEQSGLTSAEINGVTVTLTAKKQGMLGKWKQNYSFLDTRTNTTKTVHVGDDITNLREFLINLIVDLLYNGKLLNTLFEAVYPALGDAFAADTQLASVLGFDIYMPTLASALQYALPTLPHYFAHNTQIGYDIQHQQSDSNLQWANYYNGKKSSRLYFPRVLESISKSYEYTGDDRAMCADGWGSLDIYCDWSYWNIDSKTAYRAIAPQSGRVVDWSYMEANPQTTWNLNATDSSSLYYALAAAFGPLGNVLAAALTGDRKSIEAHVGSLSPTVRLELPNDNLYTRLFEPLYEILGITNYSNLATIKTLCTTSKDWGECWILNKTYGKDLWEALLSPIINWMENTLFKKPVKTIMELLPNLLAMLDDNQLIPKLKNINVAIYINFIGDIHVTDINLWDMFLGGIIEGLGFDFAGGLDGILSVLLGCTAKTSINEAPVNDDDHKTLMKYNKESGEVSETERATYKVGNTTYYFTDIGMLTQTLYNLLGDGLISWIYSKTNEGNANTIANNKKSAVPLSLPVNRLLAAGDLTSKRLEDGYDHYKISVHPGLELLELLRWIADDGTWYKIEPLLAGVMTSEPDPDNPDEEPTDIVGMIGRILDGNADNIAAILIELLNPYRVDTKTYTDTIRNGYTNFKNKATTLWMPTYTLDSTPTKETTAQAQKSCENLELPKCDSSPIIP